MKNLIIIVGIFLLTSHLIYAQSPEVSSVSYINENTLRISWRLQTSLTVAHYTVNRFDKYRQDGQPQYKPIATVTSAKYYDYIIPADSINEVIFFAVTVTYTNGTFDISNFGKKPWVDAPSNIVLNDAINLCNFQDTLKPNLFRGWKSGSNYLFLFKYRTDNEPYQYLKFGPGAGDTIYRPSSATDSTYILKLNTLLPNKVYYIYAIEKLSSGQYYERCVTNEIPLSTYTERLPDYINAHGTTVKNNNEIQLAFDMDTLSQLNTYTVERSGDLKGNFTAIDTLVITVPYFEYSDAVNINAAKNRYFYYLKLINNCGVAVDTSNVESNILLEVNRKDFNINLKWYAYETFAGDKTNYIIKRSISGSTPEHLADGPITLTYTDNIKDMKRNQVENFCYYVEASETGNPKSFEGYAKSNTVCIEVRSDLVLPEYCNPKSKPYKQDYIAYIPDQYLLIIYDRWGTKVFESKQYDEGWNGKYDNGKGDPAPQGTYLYYIKITKDNNSQEKKGYFVLVVQ
jgi:gliding motility-associated-like protein